MDRGLGILRFLGGSRRNEVTEKPRVFMPYIGGMPAYREKYASVAASGYNGFKLTQI